MGRRLSVRAVKRSAVQIALAALAAVVVSAIAWPVYGGDAFVQCLEILGPLGVGTAVIADGIANQRRLSKGLRGRRGGLPALVAAQLGAAAGLFAWRMFVSPHDALFMALAAGYCALLGLGAARLL